MRKMRIGLAAVTAGALALATVSLAKDEPAATKAVSATFTATQASHLEAKTCATKGGDTIRELHATFTGTSTSSEPSLNGPLTITVKSVFDVTKNVGFVEGKLHVDNATTHAKADARLTAVRSGNALEGLIKGRVHEPSALLLGNLSATFTEAGGFTAGQLGAGGGNNAAIVFGAKCGEDEHEDKQDVKKKQDEKKSDKHADGKGKGKK